VFRFDGMETADWEPDRRTVSVRLNRNNVTVLPGLKSLSSGLTGWKQLTGSRTAAQ
jgi:hypothetical protein